MMNIIYFTKRLPLLLLLPTIAIAESQKEKAIEAFEYFNQPFTRLDAALLNITSAAERDMEWLVGEYIGSGETIYISTKYESSPFQIQLRVNVNNVETSGYHKESCQALANEIDSWFSDGIYWEGIGPADFDSPFKQFHMGQSLGDYLQAIVTLRLANTTDIKQVIECQSGRDLFLFPIGE